MKLGLGIGLKFGRRGGGAAAPTDFRILVNTENTGVSNDDQFQFTGALGNYDVEVWDSTGTTLQETITGLSGAATITIAAGAGTYELRVFAADVGGFNRIQFNDSGDKLKLLEIRNWGDISWSTMFASFGGCSNISSVTSYSGGPNLSSVTTLRAMFAAISATSIDLSDWDVTNITNLEFMFNFVNSLNAVNLSGWNTSNVVRFDYMFNGCGDIDVSGIEDFNIGNVSNLSFMLLNATLPTSRYDALLINYEAQAPPTGLSFHAGNSQYTAGGAAETARTSLATTYTWTITDGGPA